MTYRYLNLAIGRKKEWIDVSDTVPCDMYGTVLTFNSEDEEMFGTWTKKVIDYEIKDKVMYCRLEGVIA